MKTVHIITGLLLLAAATGAKVMAQDTTSVQNGTNSATVTQSGDPADTHKSVGRAPGRTRIEQRNGSNSATIVQDSNPGAPGQDDDEEDLMPAPMPAPKPHADAAPRADVYGIVREKASPQGRANLDSLMTILGLGK